eukprot:scaffold27726_cov30-Cyclotella_meneghiniana.AAC.1
MQHSMEVVSSKGMGRASRELFPPTPTFDGSLRLGLSITTKEEQKHVQKVNGKFLWYGRAVDPTALVPLSALASQQSKPTQNTMDKSQHFLDYMATQEPAVLTYRKSDMILAVHSDAGYLNEENAGSRAGGHHFLSEDVPLPPNNGAIHNIAEIIKAVMSSAAEAETRGLYINARKAVEERNILEEMGHKQPPTPIQIKRSRTELPNFFLD